MYKTVPIGIRTLNISVTDSPCKSNVFHIDYGDKSQGEDTSIESNPALRIWKIGYIIEKGKHQHEKIISVSFDDGFGASVHYVKLTRDKHYRPMDDDSVILLNKRLDRIEPKVMKAILTAIDEEASGLLRLVRKSR